MKIEAGKYYKTRQGRKAFVEAVLNPSPFDGGHADYPCYGWIDRRGAATWMLNGTFLVGGGDGDKDIVAEWRDPIVMERELVMVRTRSGECGCTFNPFLAHDDKVIARKKVTITEGEGV